MDSVGLSGTSTLSFPSASFGFSCIYDASLGMVLFALSTGSATQSSPDWQYICPGEYSTTASSTTTDSTTASSTTTATVSSTITTVSTATVGPGYTLVPLGQSCYDVGLADVPSSDNCFNLAAPSLSLSFDATTYIASTAFKVSCVYAAATDTLIYSLSKGTGTAGSSDYQFLCVGQYTSTGTSTATTTATVTTTTYEDYTLLPAGQTCYEAGLQDITSTAQCFGPASAAFGFSSSQTTDFSGYGFTFTCVYKSSSAEVYFGDSSPGDTQATASYRYMCIGLVTTTASSSTTITTTATSFTTISETTVTATTTLPAAPL
ncbi:unnamed protein product [Prorocentrum cordatum]|uniref:Subtilisin n=1 Tax=Prorocentrum cordatum TaxID=2364126 RepID=A0ABN9PXB2_9DINO|nr:unnamed protein product [Polarella glacialis]